MSTLDSRHTLKGHAVPQGTLSSRGPSLAAQFTLSRLTAIHLVPQGTLSSRGPSLAAQFTLSRLTAIHLVPQGTLSSRGPSPPEDLLPQGTFSCCAIHLVSPGGDSPCEYPPVRSTAASLGNLLLHPLKGPTFGALPSPVHGLVLPTVPSRYVGYPMFGLVTTRSW